MEQIQLSATAIKNLQCGLKYYLANIEQWEKPEPADFLVFGRVFHHGMAIALATSLESKDINEIILAATVAANEELDEMMFELTPDADFSQEEIRIRLANMFAYYIPLVGLNERFRVARYFEVFGAYECDECIGAGTVPCPECGGSGLLHVIGDMSDAPTMCQTCEGDTTTPCLLCAGQGKIYDETPMVEYEFTVNISEDVALHGYVDAVLIDVETDECVIVDWKTVQSVRDATTAMLDDQLHLYAAALNHSGGNISRVVMWQFRKSVPKPANINKNEQPSVAAQATTWDVWYNTLPPRTKSIVDADLATWEAWATQKLKSEAEFNSPIESHITHGSNYAAIENLLAIAGYANWIRVRAKSGQVVPAIADGGFNGTCQYCPFRVLCVDTLRYGSPDFQDVLESNFVKRQR